MTSSVGCSRASQSTTGQGRTVITEVALSGAGGQLAAVIGRVLDATGNNYTLVFFACASVYVVAVVLIHFLVPRRRDTIVVGQASPVGAD